MGFSYLILLFGVCSPHWTTATSYQQGPYLLELCDGLLKNVIAHSTSDIDLIGMNLKSIAKNAFDMVTHIKTLNLSNNSIMSLPHHVFSKLTNLEELSLAYNRLQVLRFNRIFIGLNNLKRLNLTGNDLYGLGSNSFIGLPNSARVIIDTGFTDFYVIDPEDFEGSEEMLEDIRVKLCETNGTVESLSKLEKNDIFGDNCFEVAVNHQERLIDLRALGLKKFNRYWYDLTAYDIKQIDLKDNLIADITPELLNDLMVPLTINLRGNDIRIIKKNIIENKHCIKLSFGGESLQVIEDGAFERLCLTALEISDSLLNNLNFIRTLPVMIKHLVVIRNDISKIPFGLFQRLKELRWLDFSSNQLKKIRRNTFSGLGGSHKVDLVLKENDINFIAAGSFSYVNLTSLDLSSNKISNGSIRKGAFNMSVIDTIQLSRNLLTSFNEELFSGISGGCFISFDKNPMNRIKNLNYIKKISH